MKKHQTYLYNNTEVRLTGRVASKPSSTTRKYGRVESTIRLFEIEPLAIVERTWTEWVPMSDLYEISEFK